MKSGTGTTLVRVVVVRGRQVACAVFEHTSAGLHDLTRPLAGHCADELAVERPDGPVGDALLDA